jgi:hypothetical protein
VEAERDADVVVLSHRLAAELAPDGEAETLVGSMVRVNGDPRRVIGVLEPYKGERAPAGIPPAQGGAVGTASGAACPHALPEGAVGGTGG